ncbi:MAG: hypothetical protein JNL42_16570 [Anaerolineae bacterium]|nr:hypothetical protein [Anaerolineae bacterium]
MKDVTTLDQLVANLWAFHLKLPIDVIRAPGTHIITGSHEFPAPDRLVIYRSDRTAVKAGFRLYYTEEGIAISPDGAPAAGAPPPPTLPSPAVL